MGDSSLRPSRFAHSAFPFAVGRRPSPGSRSRNSRDGRSIGALTTDSARPPTTPDMSATPGIERVLAEVLADLTGVERVDLDSHFFDDLGADSLVMAHFCARLRKRPNLPSVSMKDIYRHPTVRSLATAVDSAMRGAMVAPAESPGQETVPEQPATEQLAPVGMPRYLLCGALQLLVFLGLAYLTAFVGVRGYGWISAAQGPLDTYLRSAEYGGGVFLGACVVPILAKWMLVGRWKPRRIRLWSLDYVRFWLVKTLIQLDPLVLFVGSPLYPLYLRALGAKIGRGVVIFSRNVPVCTDLLGVGAGTVIRKDSFFTCYRAQAGVIQTGTVTLGKDVYVSEATVLDVGTSLGDGAQLGHASCLYEGQAAPDGERWHGSPAQPTEVDFRMVEPTRRGALRRIIYPVTQLLGVLGLYLPVAIGGGVMLIVEIPRLAPVLLGGSLIAEGWRGWPLYRDVLIASGVFFFGLVLVGLLFQVTVPRLVSLVIKPGKVYCLYGVRYWAHRVVARATNVRFFTYLFGDSSYIVHYLRCLGYALSPVVQSGSNFGLDVKHDTPYLSSVGSGTMVADGLSIINADFSGTSFRVSRVSIGPQNFIGNYVAYPSQGRTGDNCLLATKVAVPVEGEIKEGVGLLGSPCFEIPRSVERDRRFDHLKSGGELRRRLASKTRHNTVTMGLFLLTRWFQVFVAMLLGVGIANFYPLFGMSVVTLAIVVLFWFGVVYSVLVERAAMGFHALRPQYCSIYDRYFWRHERYWKLSTQPSLLNGTPFKNVIWRLLGVRIGGRVFDDGCIIMEKTLVSIGAGSALNVGSIIQGHSQEDGTFKSDRIAIGAGCVVGVGALVHYGTTMGAGATLAPDSFLMKGEEVPQRAGWGGNPAREIRGDARVAAAGRAERRAPMTRWPMAR